MHSIPTFQVASYPLASLEARTDQVSSDQIAETPSGGLEDGLPHGIDSKRPIQLLGANGLTTGKTSPRRATLTVSIPSET